MEANVTFNGSTLASLGAPLGPQATGGSSQFIIRGSTLSLYLYYRPFERIERNAMGTALAESIRIIEFDLKFIDTHHLPETLPSDEWTFIKEDVNCIVSIQRSNAKSPTGESIDLTYPILMEVVQALWECMYASRNFFSVDFRIFDKWVGWIGNGYLSPWSATTDA